MRNNKLCFNLLAFFKRFFSYNIKKSALKTQTTVRISYHNWYRLTFVVMCLAVFYYVTQRRLVYSYRRFGEAYFLHLWDIEIQAGFL
jgi:hypothetical protein